MMCSGILLSTKLLMCQLYSNNDTFLSVETFYCCRMDKYINCLPMRISNSSEDGHISKCFGRTRNWIGWNMSWRKCDLACLLIMKNNLFKNKNKTNKQKKKKWRIILCCSLSLSKNNFLQVLLLGSCLYLEDIFSVMHALLSVLSGGCCWNISYIRYLVHRIIRIIYTGLWKVGKLVERYYLIILNL